jgi:hypothetical protein
MELHQLIYNLLFKEQCVIVPELGGFITRDSPSGVNPITKEIKPKTKSVFFNAHMLYDDGLLLNHVSSVEKISFEEAKELIAKKVKEIKDVLEENKKISFGKIGELIKNNEGNIILLVNKDLNLNLSTFGLGTIGLKPIKKINKTVVSFPVIEKTVAVEQEIIEKERSNKWMPIAASLLLLATFGYFAYANNWFGASDEFIAQNPTKGEQTAGVLSLDTEGVVDAVEATESEDVSEAIVPEEVEQEVADVALEDASGEVITIEIEEAETPTVHKAELESLEVDNLSLDKAKYLVVLGSFLSDENAERYLKILAKKGIETSLYKKKNSSLNRLVYKGYDTKEVAAQDKQNLINTLQVNAIVFEN